MKYGEQTVGLSLATEIGGLVFTKKIIFLALLVGLVGCTDPDGATRALSRDGYTQIEITGYDFMG